MLNEGLRTTLAEVTAFLEIEKVPYALIGGLAASVRGQPRVTVDVDLVMSATVDRALRLLDVLPGTNFRPLFDGVAEVVQKTFILPLRHRSTNVKVDLALGLSGFEQQAVSRAQRMLLADSQIFVATSEDLLLMKVLAGRPQDDQDVQGIVLAHGRSLDWDYCLKVAADWEMSLDQDVVGRVASLRDEFG